MHKLQKYYCAIELFCAFFFNTLFNVAKFFLNPGEMDLLVLFSKHSPLSWDAFTIGFFMALKNILKGAVLIAVLPLLFWCIGKERAIHKDLVLAQIGVMSTMLSFVNVAFARNTRVMMMGELSLLWSNLGLDYL